MKYIDGSGMVLGRLASKTAKMLLEGEEVYVANADKVIIVGKRDMILKRYRDKRSLVHPRKGPYYPKRADRILKRTVRDMLPYQKPKGRKALSHFKAFIGKPEEYFPEGTKYTKIEDADRGRPYKYIELGEVSRLLGAKE